MREVKRLEVVIDALHVEAVLRTLHDAGVDGYTVVREASGWGDRGARRPDGISGVFENCLILCAVDPEVMEQVTTGLRPVLQRHGGVALLSDAQWITH
ncbi:MAG: transcriptional regulator [Planctomycetota bacterium]